MIDVSTPQGLLTALLFPVFVINWLVTHVLNTWPRWIEIPADRQHVILLVLAAIIALLAYAALHFIPGTVFAQQDVQNIYAILYALFTAYLSGQFSQGISTWGRVRRLRLQVEHTRLRKEIVTLKAV